MADMKTLAKFTIAEAGEEFSLHIEDEAGHVLEFSATRDQIDLIADRLDEILSQGDAVDDVETDDEEAKGEAA